MMSLNVEPKEQNKQSRNRLIETKTDQCWTEGREVGGLGGKGAGVKKYRLVVTEQSQARKLLPREYRQ